MRPLKNLCEIAVIGGGIAGLSAARQAARLGRLVTLFEGSGLYGGQVATVNDVEGLPVPGRFSGQDLALHLLEQCRKVGVQVIETQVTQVDAGPILTLIDDAGTSYHPGAIIIATGASLRPLGVDNEERFVGRGVSRCADCDGGFFRGQDVVVVGGGDAAVHEALLLAKTSRRVIMVCHSALKAKREYIDRLAARDDVQFIWDSEVEAILGEDGVTGVRIRNLRDGSAREIACMGVFPFIGVAPNSALVPAALHDSDLCLPTDPDLATADPRLFAVGAVRAGYGGNLVEAMAEGVGAADSAARLLEAKGLRKRGPVMAEAV